METEDLIKEFNGAVSLFHQNKIIRFVKRPYNFIAWKMLELLATWSDNLIKITTKTFWDENMKVVFPEIVSMSIFKYGFHEEDLTRIFLENLKPAMVLLDIGAHFGYYTLLGSFLVGKQGKVHSFEPTKSSYNILRENTFSKKNITINNCGVLNSNKKINFNDYGIKYSAFNSLYGPRLQRKIKSTNYLIDCISVDNYVEKENIFPNFIKIDAESSEYDIILGMKNTIRKCKPFITIEVGDEGIEGIPKNKEIIGDLLSNGYQAYEYHNGKIIKHKISSGDYAYNNILFRPY